MGGQLTRQTKGTGQKQTNATRTFFQLTKTFSSFFAIGFENFQVFLRLSEIFIREQF